MVHDLPKIGSVWRIGGNGWWRIKPNVRIKTKDLIVVTNVDKEFVYVDVLRREHKIGSQQIRHSFFKEDFLPEQEN